MLRIKKTNVSVYIQGFEIMNYLKFGTELFGFRMNISIGSRIRECITILLLLPWPPNQPPPPHSSTFLGVLKLHQSGWVWKQPTHGGHFSPRWAFLKMKKIFFQSGKKYLRVNQKNIHFLGLNFLVRGGHVKGVGQTNLLVRGVMHDGRNRQSEGRH